MIQHPEAIMIGNHHITITRFYPPRDNQSSTSNVYEQQVSNYRKTPIRSMYGELV